MDDDGLMRQAAAGDMQAFGRLVRAHQRRLVRFAARMLDDDPEQAEDVVQEAFVRLWRARERYQATENLLPLLLRIVRNVCLDHLRRTHPCEPLERAAAIPTRSEAAPEQQTEARALAKAVREAVRALPEPQRAAFVLSHYEKLSYAEIAQILGCPVGTVASRKHLALETLRRRLGAWKEEQE
jgi:RNA polymerase sigma-70 factor (ECF subfamily)